MNKKLKIILQYNSYVLAISYNDYRNSIGGTDKVILSQKEKLSKNQISYLFLFPQVIRIKTKYVMAHMWEAIGDGKSFGIFSTNEIQNELLALSEKRHLYSISIHHLLNMYYKDLYKILDNFPVPIFFFIHDYYSICPQCFLLKNAKEFCGIDGYREEKCKTCYYYPQVKEHHKQVLDFLNRYEQRLNVITPSKNAKDIWSYNYSKWKDKVEVVPHIIPEGVSSEKKTLKEKKIRIAFVGQQIYLKGWLIWKEVQKQFREEESFQYYYFGHIKEKLPNTSSIEVNFQKEGQNAMLQALKKNKIQVAVLWSICPETFSFTYYECFAAGIFVITNQNNGNIAAMVRENKNGIVLKDEIELSELLSRPKELKEKIKEWKKENQNYPETLKENLEVFENRFFYSEDFHIKDNQKEDNIFLKKGFILFYKWIKKWAVKLFY